MKKAVAIVAVLLVVLAPAEAAWAQRRARGSVSAASRGSVSRTGNTASWQGSGGRASGSASASRTESGATTSRQGQTQGGASRDVTREFDQENRSVDTSSSVTTGQGQTANRERTATADDGRLNVEGSASTGAGREAEGQAVVGRNAFGQPAAAGSVSAESGNYAAAARRNPYGGYTTAAAGPYGGKVTTTLPSGYRTTTYHGRPYYSYGGAYYRPYPYGGVHYYYPVPPPYYSYYNQPPVGAMILVVAGVTYMVSQQGSYSTKTTSSDGQVAYQTVPAPEGAELDTLPAERVIVTVSGTTYYLYSNTFYRRVAQGAQEQFVVVTAPAGVVFVAALPPDFEVVQLNSMYFLAGGNYYVPYLSADGDEKYVLVDVPPMPPGTPASPGAQPATAVQPPATQAPPAAPPIRDVAETLSVPSETLLLVRLEADVSSATAKVGDRFQGFLDQDLAANGRLIVAKGARIYGAVTAVDDGSKMSGKASLSATLTDIQVGDQVVPIETQPLTVEGGASSGAKKVAGAGLLGATIGAIAGGGEGAAIGAAVGAGAGGVAAAAGSVDAAVIPAQTLEAFTVAVPFQVQIMTSVAVR